MSEPSRDAGITPEAKLGWRVGHYQLVRLLGQSDMGEVYLAVRTDDFEKRVALKLIRDDTDSARFADHLRTERQILARLEHPSIARILDAGTTEDGHPFLVMEYVDGERLDVYCRHHRLSIRRRLELFRQVCAAVAAAHRQLVVHRELKPGNIRVTAEGTVKLLDFGVAGLLAPASETPPEGSSPTTPTPLKPSGGSAPITSTWASPEQLAGDPITTLSDVYSLGTVLYQLLTGRHPCPPEDGGWDNSPRIHATEAPPSVASVASDDDSGLAGDLDAIVHKAMHQRSEHRYRSVEQLAEDLEHYLAGLPVEAREGGWAYRGGKLVRRHKLAIAMLLLVLGVGVVTSALWWQAVRQRAEAVRQLDRAESVSRFLEQLFAGHASGRDAAVSVRQLLDRGRQRLTQDLAALPEVRAELAGTLGSVYSKLGLNQEARELLMEAVRSRRTHRPEDHHELAIDVNNLGSLLYRIGDYIGAERSFRDALAIRRQLGQAGAEMLVPMVNLASLLSYRGAFEEAEQLYRQLLTIQEQADGPDAPSVGIVLYNLGSLHYRSGDPEAAEPLLRRALAIRHRTYGSHDTRVATVENTLGRVYLELGDVDGARRLFEQALAVRRQLLGDEHPHVAVTRRDLAQVFLATGDTVAAGEALASALAVLRRTRATGDVSLATTESVYGAWLVALGRYPEAEPYLVASHRILREIQGERSIYTRDAKRRIEDLYRLWDRSGAGES